MKIKRNLYCITDKWNKPDYRFLFEDQSDAQKKIKQIKNSTKGETLFISNSKRDFFVDGVKKDFIGSERRVAIKRGCWTALKVKELHILDTIEPERFFKKVQKAEHHEFSYSKQRSEKQTTQSINIQVPVIRNPLLGFQWETSILRTKTFAATVATLVMAVAVGLLTFNAQVSDRIARETLEAQGRNNEKMLALQSKLSKTKAEASTIQFDEELNKLVMDTMKGFSDLKQDEYESQVRRIVAGSPMENMVPYIVQKDRTVAAFLVGIAKKESNFGRHVPVLAGQDCFNYWGYRGIRARMGTGGHTCFDSPEDAVNTVAKRIEDLVKSEIDTPQEMVIWKCGSACHEDSQQAVSKWISDVNLYYSKLKVEESVPADNSNS